MKAKAPARDWHVYMIQSEKDESIYIGISSDVENRVANHNNGTGAKRTSGSGPWKLVWKSETLTNRSEASILECKLKKLSRAKKLNLIKK